MPAIAHRLNSRYEQWAADLTDEHARALVDWQGPKHRLLNDLWRAIARQPQRVDEFIDRLGEDIVNELLESGRWLAEACSLEMIPESLTVHRGIDKIGHDAILETLGTTRLAVGDSIWDEGFMATSLHERFARSQMKEYGGALMLEIRVPAGKAAAWLPAIIASPDQGELLFAPPTELVVVSVEGRGQDFQVLADTWVE